LDGGQRMRCRRGCGGRWRGSRIRVGRRCALRDQFFDSVAKHLVRLRGVYVHRNQCLRIEVEVVGALDNDLSRAPQRFLARSLSDVEVQVVRNPNPALPQEVFIRGGLDRIRHPRSAGHVLSSPFLVSSLLVRVVLDMADCPHIVVPTP
jgi:hypothetical protein